MDNICRLCARRSLSLQPIFSIHNGRLLYDIIIIMCPIKIEASDNLPKQVCEECLEVVLSANELRATSLSSDINFRLGTFKIPEDNFYVKEEHPDDELLIEDEQMIDYPMPSSSRAFSSSSDESYNQQQRQRKKASNKRMTKKAFVYKRKPFQSKARRFNCPLNCGTSFSFKNAVYTHSKGKHGIAARFSAELDKFIVDGAPADNQSHQDGLNQEEDKSRPDIENLGQCGICGTLFRSSQMEHHKFRAHQEIQAKEGHTFECDLCTEKFTHRKSIEQHFRNIHFKELQISQPNRYSCPLNCGANFTFKNAIYGHVKNCHKREVQKFKCKLGCNRIFFSELSRLKHVKSKTCIPALDRAIPELPICHICGKTTQSATAMRTHIRTHEDSKGFHCTQCPSNFSTEHHLKRHLIVHMKDRPHSCEKCGNTFKDERSLRVHGLNIHDKIRNNACEFCGKKFFTSFKLNQHMRTHTGEKPFMCKFCDMAYAQNADLLRHLRRAHVGDAIYECTIDGCTESFRLKSERLEHYEVHYQNKPPS